MVSVQNNLTNVLPEGLKNSVLFQLNFDTFGLSLLCYISTLATHSGDGVKINAHVNV